jgi:hypothetical protein
MTFFDGSLLPGTHGIAVVDGGTDEAVPVDFKGVRITEFRAPVRKDSMEECQEVIVAEILLEPVKDSPYGAFGTALEEVGKEEFCIRKAKGQETLKRAFGRQDGIHLDELGSGETKGLEILVGAADKDITVLDGFLSVIRLPGLELYLAFKVNVPGSEDTLVDVVVHGLDGHLKLRMVAQDVIRGLAVKDQRLNNSIHPADFGPGAVDALSGRGKGFLILPLCKERVIIILDGYRAFIPWLVASVAYKGSLLKPYTGFLFKVSADLVAPEAGTALAVTDKELFADVGSLAAETVDAEVLRVIETAYVGGVCGAVELHLFGDGGRIFAEIAADLPEGEILHKGIGDVLPVLKCEMFLVARYKFRHDGTSFLKRPGGYRRIRQKIE